MNLSIEHSREHGDFLVTNKFEVNAIKLPMHSWIRITDALFSTGTAALNPTEDNFLAADDTMRGSHCSGESWVSPAISDLAQL